MKRKKKRKTVRKRKIPKRKKTRTNNQMKKISLPKMHL